MLIVLRLATILLEIEIEYVIMALIIEQEIRYEAQFLFSVTLRSTRNNYHKL